MTRWTWGLPLTIALVASISVSLWANWANARPESAHPSVIDVGFAQHMSQHHDQALMLVSLFLKHHETPLRSFAENIQHTQLMEIGQMRGWLKLWEQPLAPRSRSMDWLLAGTTPPDQTLRDYLIACEASASGMPGLATAEDLHKLTTLRGTERDLLFLKLMQRHHQGGLPMMAFTAEQASAPAVRQLAEQMLVNQLREVARMTAYTRTDSDRTPTGS